MICYPLPHRTPRKIPKLWKSTYFCWPNTKGFSYNFWPYFRGRSITVQLFVVLGIAIGHVLDGKYLCFCSKKDENKEMPFYIFLGTVLAYTSTAVPSIETYNATNFVKDDYLKPLICKYENLIFWQNSQFQSLTFHKIHIFKVSLFTKFTFF